MEMTLFTDRTRRVAGATTGVRPRHGQAGFSLVEVMVAAFILLAVLLALVPLFTRSVMANVTGFEYTEVSNAARSRAEEFLQYDFNSPELTIGAGTERTYTDVYSEARREWIDPAEIVSPDYAVFTRTTVVRQFSVTDLTTPLTASAPPAAIHLKEIVVSVEGLGLPGAIGPGKSIGIRVLKSQ